MKNTLKISIVDKGGNIVQTADADNVMVPNWLVFKNQNMHGGNSSVVSCAVMDLDAFGGTPTLSRVGELSVPWGTCYRLENPTLTPLGNMMYQYSGTFNPPLADLTVRGFGLTASHGGCANQLMSFVSIASPILWTTGNSLAFTYTISFYQTTIPE